MATNILTRKYVWAGVIVLAMAGVAGYIWNEEHRPPLLEVFIFNMKNGNSEFFTAFGLRKWPRRLLILALIMYWPYERQWGHINM